jgi:hypothetical protein
MACCEQCSAEITELNARLSELDRRLDALLQWIQDKSPSSLPDELIEYEG